MGILKNGFLGFRDSRYQDNVLMNKFDTKGKVPEGNHYDMRGGAVETMYESLNFFIWGSPEL